jgi:uncharacterized protein Usg
MARHLTDVTANEGYGLTTAQIVYRMPDHLALFQDFIWQRYDTFPNFPVLTSFLAFWEEKIEGPIHSVTVAHARLLRPRDLREMMRQRH